MADAIHFIQLQPGQTKNKLIDLTLSSSDDDDDSDEQQQNVEIQNEVARISEAPLRKIKAPPNRIPRAPLTPPLTDSVPSADEGNIDPRLAKVRNLAQT